MDHRFPFQFPTGFSRAKVFADYMRNIGSPPLTIMVMDGQTWNRNPAETMDEAGSD
jgi:hypothetical protein